MLNVIEYTKPVWNIHLYIIAIIIYTAVINTYTCTQLGSSNIITGSYSTFCNNNTHKDNILSENISSCLAQTTVAAVQTCLTPE